TPAAEHSWLLLMACARKLNSAFHSVLEGNWERNNFPGIMLKGKTIGIIGCGRIGQWVSRYAAAFGLKILGFDPYLENFPANIESVSLEYLLSNSDFISVHVPLNEETKGLLGKEELAKVKNG